MGGQSDKGSLNHGSNICNLLIISYLFAHSIWDVVEWSVHPSPDAVDYRDKARTLADSIKGGINP